MNTDEKQQPRTVDMTYGTMRNYFRAAENSGQHLTGYIVFSKDSFTTEYSEQSRTYTLPSDNKAFQPNKGGYSIFASCLDGTDPCLRLEGFMRDEKGGKDGWKVERCYMAADEAERGKALLRKEQDRGR